jgi:hypothetical protein
MLQVVYRLSALEGQESDHSHDFPEQSLHLHLQFNAPSWLIPNQLCAHMDKPKLIRCDQGYARVIITHSIEDVQRSKSQLL